jgi:ankyrin repeat protein
MAAEAEAVVPFFEAVLLGVVAEVGRLLDEDGRLVEARVGPGCTPLLLAAGRGRVDVVRLLLERGADIKASDELGNSALHHAVLTSSNEEVVDVLLDWGVDASRAGPRGVTPLMLASSQGKTGAVARVLRALRGQGLNAQAETGATALWGACNMGHTDTAKVLLLEGADHTIGDHDGVTARMKAEDKGHEECVALIQVRTT